MLKGWKKDFISGFNPCFTGSLTATVHAKVQPTIVSGFNPCFTGSLTATS